MLIRTQAARAGCAVALVLGLAGCGDPGPTSINIALARDADGGLRLLGHMCDSVLESIELVDGGDRWADATSRVVAPDALTGRFEVDLDDPQDGFTVDPELDEPGGAEVPLAVRLVATDGVWGDQVFTELPDVGMAVFETDADDGPVERPVGEFPQVSPDCG